MCCWHSWPFFLLFFSQLLVVFVIWIISVSCDSGPSECKQQTEHISTNVSSLSLLVMMSFPAPGFRARSEAAVFVSGHFYLHAKPAEGHRGAGLDWRHDGDSDQHSVAQTRWVHVFMWHHHFAKQSSSILLLETLLYGGNCKKNHLIYMFSLLSHFWELCMSQEQPVSQNWGQHTNSQIQITPFSHL